SSRRGKLPNRHELQRKIRRPTRNPASLLLQPHHRRPKPKRPPRIRGSDYAYLSGDISPMSTDGRWPLIKSATILPLIGPRLTPIIAWPVAVVRLLILELRPKYGSPSGLHGRSPHHGSIDAK